MHPVGVGYTDVGRERDKNEDSFYVDDERRLYIVSDGMGGHASGEVASATAIEVLAREIGRRRGELQKLSEGKIDQDRLAVVVRESVEKAGQAVHDKANAEEDHAGMGCTLTMLLVLGNKAVMAHIGDTRLYLLRDKRLSQLSSDHTMAQELCNAGLIEQHEVGEHQYAHVLSRALGPKADIRVDTLVLDVLPGDRFLLCSDGLSEYIESDEWLERELIGYDDPEVAAEELVSYANAAGGHDNITAVVVQLYPDDPEIEIVDEMSVDIQLRFEALGGVFLFDGLSLALLARVLSHCELNEYRRGDVVVHEGDPLDQLMVVVHGRFSVTHHDKQVGFLDPGDHAGETTMLSPRRARATVTATDLSRMLVLTRKDFWKLVRSRPWLGVGLLERLGRRLSLDLDRSIEQRDEGDTPSMPPEPREIV